MRLDKFICESTELTRSLAKRVIKSGEVTCNGDVVKDASFKVKDDTEVCIEGRQIKIVGERYIMMHKPVDTICSTIDEEYQSVLGLMDIEKVDTLHIAGRLDVDTTGLVLITSDGQWSHKITSPKKDCGKRYLIEAAASLDPALVETFAEGIQLKSEDGLTKPALLEIIDEYHARLTISEGKYHQVKRMFAAVGNRVVNLHREAVGEIELDADLEEGEWRFLTDAEIASI
ncbi:MULTISPECIES: 16S rRNA pseudouridine(516) synthase RsuA [unclassified Shewanella]|uniref:16S rRNA pseudouridine(516) synthase RsuA n=1 Tax=unclassified Shewanella TaxID=196818 RepID=UPI000C83B34E|nr:MULTISPECIES: 16S rRNA pseudouridine(516) synthase RsuA [unclassified Shewanella]MDO6619756.1 16S rRNA pseudouridine(516) synthase RsuA [Shewanella sp. 6_MG-2023]MDO6638686.1 16S rRNA pseudouridine(516) synthase RsuA [Shewanella sp. 5_MG-2023]MDO6680183.1 16S rRNA pseudouridine(516) synthase RsuA [Shewanella sp. 4_MG-2023]MDO6774154.1 16S rRNA pseudouridine(516) synthase RsuA [Shewanella sp. 3_MG-2023]PMG32165.1 16S rRNA pseudouridine(516) synthase [Shewanella sp. 10N.286.52.C2]